MRTRGTFVCAFRSTAIRESAGTLDTGGSEFLTLQQGRECPCVSLWKLAIRGFRPSTTHQSGRNWPRRRARVFRFGGRPRLLRPTPTRIDGQGAAAMRNGSVPRAHAEQLLREQDARRQVIASPHMGCVFRQPEPGADDQWPACFSLCPQVLAPAIR